MGDEREDNAGKVLSGKLIDGMMHFIQYRVISDNCLTRSPDALKHTA